VIHRLAVALLLLGPASFALAADCSKLAQGTAEYHACSATNSLEAIDKQMTARYNRMLTAFAAPRWSKEKELLVASQRAWQTYRDRECAFAQELIGGAGRTTELTCKTDMTKDRALLYERLLKQMQ
jgi:uncharacterized protein YecT (DUF1311 family)